MTPDELLALLQQNGVSGRSPRPTAFVGTRKDVDAFIAYVRERWPDASGDDAPGLPEAWLYGIPIYAMEDLGENFITVCCRVAAGEWKAFGKLGALLSSLGA